MYVICVLKYMFVLSGITYHCLPLIFLYCCTDELSSSKARKEMIKKKRKKVKIGELVLN